MGTDAQQMTDACAGAGALAAEHGLLKGFEGRWRAEVRMWMDPGQDLMVSTGVMVNRLVLGGRFLEQDYADDAGMFQGRGLFGYNTIEQRWEGLWIDTMATFMMHEHGSYDAGTRTWEMSEEIRDPGSGHLMRKRSVVTVTDADRHTMAMFFTPLAGENEGRESKCMEIAYERA
jgi:hypothetical protein